MKPRIGHRIFRKSLISFFVEQPHPLSELFLRHLETIVIDEIIPRIIRWIDIDHLHLPEICFLQEFQRLQIIPLYIEILCLLPVLALLRDRAEGLADRAICLDDCLSFSHPCEFIGFITFHFIWSDELLQDIEIHAASDLPMLLYFRGTLGKEGEEFLHVFLREVRCFHFHLIH